MGVVVELSDCVIKCLRETCGDCGFYEAVDKALECQRKCRGG